MIITRTPLRMSFVGGGSDIEAYYKQNGGSVISTTIDRYVYLNVHRGFNNNVRVAYSRVEEVSDFSAVNHPLVRETANYFHINNGLEVTSIADIPSKGTGLGSSSSFTVGLVHAFAMQLGLNIDKLRLAEIACQIEIDQCGQLIGKQDQYAAALGGFNVFHFEPDGSVVRKPILLGDHERHILRSWMMVFYTGGTRSASKILAEQSQNSESLLHRSSLDQMVKLVDPFRDALINADPLSAGRLLDENWNLKRTLASGVSNHAIDCIYETALSNGAIGGKLLGAGTGGFMLFLAPPNKHNDISKALNKLKQFYWNFDLFGSTVIMHT